MINYDDKLKDSRIYNNIKIKNDELESILLIYNINQI